MTVSTPDLAFTMLTDEELWRGSDPDVGYVPVDEGLAPPQGTYPPPQLHLGLQPHAGHPTDRQQADACQQLDLAERQLVKGRSSPV